MDLISGALRGFIVFTVLLTCISLSVDSLLEGGFLSDSFDDCISLLEAQSKGEQIIREAATTTRRLHAKAEIAEALQNGDMTLIDAAAYFRWLHEDPKTWHYPDRPRPEPQDTEGWCREVIEWTARYLSFGPPPNQTDGLRPRLEAELQTQLGGHGTVTLPE
jgi:hypothetical protein